MSKMISAAAYRLWQQFALTKGVTVQRYGGQLRALHNALSDPLQQMTGIVLIGDSITWGLTLPGNATSTPRVGNLSDPRDYYATPSFANEFKRGIAQDYFNGVAPVLSNWSYAGAAGESTATYTRTVELYPGQAPIVTTLTGASSNANSANTGGAELGYRYQITDGDSGGSQQISFNFTGTTFDLVYTSVAVNVPMKYELFVDGVSQGQFTTLNGTQNKLVRTHTFGYVRNKQIVIKAVRVAGAGVQYLELEAIRINKQVSITTQGIIGTDTKQFSNNNFGANGPSVMTADTNFVFVQLGTNDRIANKPAQTAQANGVASFKLNLQGLLTQITPTASVILMSAGPATLDSAPTYTFGMQDCRNTIATVASSGGYDFIDHFAALQGWNQVAVLADGLHPNQQGHAIMAKNMLNALRST